MGHAFFDGADAKLPGSRAPGDEPRTADGGGREHAEDEAAEEKEERLGAGGAPTQASPRLPRVAPAAAGSAPEPVIDHEGWRHEQHAPPPAEPPPAEPPPVVQAPAHLASTGMALNLPAAVWEEKGKLPFRPPGPPGEVSPGKGAAKTKEVPVMRSGLGETAPVGDNSVARTIAALPFAGNTIGAGTVPFPRLTLEQYASFCEELARWPGKVDEILLRYHVLSNEARGALDDHWQRHFAERPEAPAAFAKARALYTAWLVKLPR